MTDDLIRAIAEAADRWSDPEYEPRQQAVECTLDADNSFTETATAFAVNQQMSLLTVSGLRSWADRLRADGERRDDLTIGVLNAGNLPLVGLQDLIAVLLGGFGYLGTLSSKSPCLLPAFIDEIASQYSELPAATADFSVVLDEADALIGSGSDETMDEVRARALRAGIPTEHLWLRGHRCGVAVLDGAESDSEREALAEDALLHEGLGCRSAAIVWAPEGTQPDSYAEAFAECRGTYPAPEQTIGPLKMQQAYLQAVGVPLAWADDYQFLISRGDPEVQGPGHVRWCVYADLSEAARWVEANRDRIQAVYTPERLQRTFPEAERLGSAQRPALDWEPDGQSHADFLAGLSA